MKSCSYGRLSVPAVSSVLSSKMLLDSVMIDSSSIKRCVVRNLHHVDPAALRDPAVTLQELSAHFAEARTDSNQRTEFKLRSESFRSDWFHVLPPAANRTVKVRLHRQSTSKHSDLSFSAERIQAGRSRTGQSYDFTATKLRRSSNLTSK